MQLFVNFFLPVGFLWIKNGSVMRLLKTITVIFLNVDPGASCGQF
jgi:hypothetical protein